MIRNVFSECLLFFFSLPPFGYLSESSENLCKLSNAAIFNTQVAELYRRLLYLGCKKPDDQVEVKRWKLSLRNACFSMAPTWQLFMYRNSKAPHLSKVYKWNGESAYLNYSWNSAIHLSMRGPEVSSGHDVISLVLINMLSELWFIYCDLWL